MAIEFACPDCGKGFSVNAELAGKRGKCPACGQAFRVPDGPDDPGSSVAVESDDGPGDDLPGPDDHREIPGMGRETRHGEMGRRLAEFERNILRLALYGLILRGLFVPGEDEPGQLFGHLCLLFGVSALAIVAWAGRADRDQAPFLPPSARDRSSAKASARPIESTNLS